MASISCLPKGISRLHACRLALGPSMVTQLRACILAHIPTHPHKGTHTHTHAHQKRVRMKSRALGEAPRSNKGPHACGATQKCVHACSHLCLSSVSSSSKRGQGDSRKKEPLQWFTGSMCSSTHKHTHKHIHSDLHTKQGRSGFVAGSFAVARLQGCTTHLCLQSTARNLSPSPHQTQQGFLGRTEGNRRQSVQPCSSGCSALLSNTVICELSRSMDLMLALLAWWSKSTPWVHLCAKLARRQSVEP
eukprot:340513-Pelagomonas_calceolata.AAC.5